MPNRSLAVLLAALASVVLTACKGAATSSLGIVPDPPSLVADGQGTVLLTVTASQSGSPAADGTAIALSTTGGSFAPDDASVRTFEATIMSGLATVKLYAPTSPVDAVVSGTFDDFGTPVSGQATVHFKAPPLAVSLAFGCEGHTLGVSAAGGIQTMRCHVQAKDANGADIAAAQIGFLTEAGTLTIDNGPPAADGTRAVTYSADGTTIGTSAGPVDVDPFDQNGKPQSTCTCGLDPFKSTCLGEPCYVANGRIHNPRDGVVTLVAYVRGMTASGLDTVGEPFVDSNDNGTWDSGNEVCLHAGAKSTTACNAATGGQSDAIYLWQSFRVVWAGEPITNQPFAGISVAKSSITWGAGKGTAVTVRVVDANLNPVAAYDNGDAIALSADCGEFSPAISGGLPLVVGSAGMSFTASGAIQSPFLRASYTGDTLFPNATFGTLTFQDLTCPAMDEQCTLSATVTHTVAPGGSGSTTMLDPRVVLVPKGTCM